MKGSDLMSFKRTIQRALVAVSLLAPTTALAQAPGPGVAQILGQPVTGDTTWIVREERNGNVGLTWETAETNHVTVDLSCRASDRSLHMIYYVEPANARDGVEMQVTLASEGGAVELGMTGHRPEEGNAFYFLNIQTQMTPALARVLTTGPSLVIRIQGDGRATAIPLAGSAQGMAALVRVCGGG